MREHREKFKKRRIAKIDNDEVEDDVDDHNKDPVLERRSWRKWIKESRKPSGGQPPKSTGRQCVKKTS